MKIYKKIIILLIICSVILIFVGCSRVSFLDADGSEISETKVFFLAKNIKTPNFAELEKEGYSFKYWSLQPEGISYEFNKRVVKDLSLYAVYEKKVYTVQFFDGEQLIETVEVKYGDTITQFPDLKKDGYSLSWQTEDSGYFNSTSEVRQNLSLIANWEINSFTVSFLDEDGHLLCVQNVEYESTIGDSLPEVQYGYYISDLFLDDLHAIRYSTTQPVTEDLTLYCELSPKHYMVSFYSLEKLIDQQEVVYDDTVNLPSLADRKDYVFKYWATSKNGVAFSKNTPIHEDLNLYAVWQIHLSFSSFLLKVFFPIICVALFSYLLYWNTRKRKLEEESNIATLKQQKQQYIEERTTLEKVVNSLKKEKSQISKDIEKLKGIPSSENLVKKLDSEVLSLKMQKQDLKDEIENLYQESTEIENKREKLQKDVHLLKVKFEHTQKEEQEWERLLTDVAFIDFTYELSLDNEIVVNVLNDKGRRKEHHLLKLSKKMPDESISYVSSTEIKQCFYQFLSILSEYSIEFSLKEKDEIINALIRERDIWRKYGNNVDERLKSFENRWIKPTQQINKHSEFTNDYSKNKRKSGHKEKRKSLQEYRDELNSMIGLQSVKKQVNEIIDQYVVSQAVKDGKDIVHDRMHMVFLGNPGTGKTTVARLIGKIFASLGLLSEGQFIEGKRSTLVAGYQGQTALKTENLMDSALGGVLFIDEAYSLNQGLSDDYGHEAVDELVKYMEDNKDNVIVIVAGYPKEMNEFLDMNSGLRSRFPITINFEDYSASELYEILLLLCKKDRMKLSDEASIYVKGLFENLCLNKEANFQNGRLVDNIFAAAKRKQDSRIAKKYKISPESSISEDLKKEIREEKRVLIKEDFVGESNG